MQYKEYGTTKNLDAIYESESLNRSSSARTLRERKSKYLMTPSWRDKLHLKAESLKARREKIDEDSFFEKMQQERKRITLEKKSKKGTKKKIRNRSSLKQNRQAIMEGFTKPPQSKLLSGIKYNLMGNEQRRSWLRSMILELALFSDAYVPVEIYRNAPVIRNDDISLKYVKGALNLIELCEKKITLGVLSSSEKAKLLSSPFSFICMLQEVYNRLLDYTIYMKTKKRG